MLFLPCVLVVEWEQQDMLKAEVDKNTDTKGFVFDGFPRTHSQAAALDAFLAEKGEGINGMVALEVNFKRSF